MPTNARFDQQNSQVSLAFVRRQLAETQDPSSRLVVPTDKAQGDHTESHWCQATDLSESNDIKPGLGRMGFSQIDLSEHSTLQHELKRIREAGEIQDNNAASIRRQIQGKTFRTKDGKRLKILFVAGEGLIMRRSGPNGLLINPEQAMTQYNGHHAADKVHGDQNVYGTPVKQMLKGFAPWLFRHQTRGKSNRLAPLYLLNLWIPLQQNTQPLALADRRTVNGVKHQADFALPTDDFLDRQATQRLNDIWLFLYDEQQQWFYDSAMDHRSAYVFDTLGAPHGAATLIGEDVAESQFRLLQSLIAKVKAQDASANTMAANYAPRDVPENTATPLRNGIKTMDLLIEQAKSLNVAGQEAELWLQQAQQAMNAMIRKSVELRVVALPLP